MPSLVVVDLVLASIFLVLALIFFYFKQNQAFVLFCSLTFISIMSAVVIKVTQPPPPKNWRLLEFSRNEYANILPEFNSNAPTVLENDQIEVKQLVQTELTFKKVESDEDKD